MKNEGGREAGKCSKVVPDRGDRCLFIFLWSRRLFCNVFPYPVCKAQLIGDWYENRQGARNTIILLIIRQYYWRTDVPCANSNGGPNTKKKLLAHCVWSGLPIGGGGHRCANILAHRSTLPTEKETTCTSTMLVVWRHISCTFQRGAPNSSVRLAYFHTNRLLIELYKQETEIRCRKDDGNIKK